MTHDDDFLLDERAGLPTCAIDIFVDFEYNFQEVPSMVLLFEGLGADDGLHSSFSGRRLGQLGPYDERDGTFLLDLIDGSHRRVGGAPGPA